MKGTVGVWIDHKQAFISFAGQQPQRVESAMESRNRYSGRALEENGSADNQLDRQYYTHLNNYYDRVVSLIAGAESILIFGPGEAKTEFKSRLQHHKRGDHIAKIEAAGKMTPGQIAAKTRDYFKLSVD